MKLSSKLRLRPRHGAIIAAVLATAIAGEARAQAPAPPPAAAPAPQAAPPVVPPTTEATPPPVIDTPAAPPAEPVEPAPEPAPVEPTPTPDPSAAAAAIEAELAASAVAEAPSGGPTLSLYGFADFTFTSMLTESPFAPAYESFSVGNLNVYLNADLGKNWRSLSEIRFTYLPHGAVRFNTATLQQARTDTTSPDYTDLNRPMQVGGIEIERAWLEYSPHELLTIRGGQWLTPYGIWNVDHGSPVIIGVKKPYIVGESLFPERQTGLELYGSVYVDATQLGYHLTLSNGRGPVDAYQDFDHNKAIGGRLFVKNDSLLGNLTFGVAGYRGTYTDRTVESAIVDGKLAITDPIISRYEELSLSADVKWEFQDFSLQGEAILNDVAYDDDVRPVDPAFTGGPPGWVPDSRRYGLYALAAYRTPLLNLMPFFGGEYYNLGPHNAIPDAAAIWGGVNMRVIPSVVLKAQYTHSWRPQTPAALFSDDKMNILDLQAAWSF